MAERSSNSSDYNGDGREDARSPPRLSAMGELGMRCLQGAWRNPHVRAHVHHRTPAWLQDAVRSRLPRASGFDVVAPMTSTMASDTQFTRDEHLAVVESLQLEITRLKDEVQDLRSAARVADEKMNEAKHQSDCLERRLASIDKEHESELALLDKERQQLYAALAVREHLLAQRDRLREHLIKVQTCQPFKLIWYMFKGHNAVAFVDKTEEEVFKDLQTTAGAVPAESSDNTRSTAAISCGDAAEIADMADSAAVVAEVARAPAQHAEHVTTDDQDVIEERIEDRVWTVDDVADGTIDLVDADDQDDDVFHLPHYCAQPGEKQLGLVDDAGDGARDNVEGIDAVICVRATKRKPDATDDLIVVAEEGEDNHSAKRQKVNEDHGGTGMAVQDVDDVAAVHAAGFLSAVDTQRSEHAERTCDTMSAAVLALKSSNESLRNICRQLETAVQRSLAVF